MFLCFLKKNLKINNKWYTKRVIKFLKVLRVSYIGVMSAYRSDKGDPAKFNNELKRY